MHTAPAPSGHPFTWSTSNLTAPPATPGVTAAEQRQRAAESAHAEAAAKATAARAAESIAADAKVGADDRATTLRRTHARAAEAVKIAETAWQEVQSAERWDTVEAARSVEAKSALRLRQAEADAALAEGDLAAATRRAQDATAAEQDAARERARAEELLAAQRRSARELSEREAAKAAADAREAEALQRDREAWHADVARELVPRVERYLRAVAELRAAEADLGPALLPLRDRGRALASRDAGQSGAVSADLDLRADPVDLLNLASHEAARALNWRVRDSGPWGNAPFARPKSYTRDGLHRGRNALFDTIRAAVERVKAGA